MVMLEVSSFPSQYCYGHEERLPFSLLLSQASRDFPGCTESAMKRDNTWAKHDCYSLHSVLRLLQMSSMGSWLPRFKSSHPLHLPSCKPVNMVGHEGQEDKDHTVPQESDRKNKVLACEEAFMFMDVWVHIYIWVHIRAHVWTAECK